MSIIEWLDKNAKKICRLKLPKEAAHGCFVAPAFYEIKSLSQLNRENFGPILHVIRFAGDGSTRSSRRSTRPAMA